MRLLRSGLAVVAFFGAVWTCVRFMEGNAAPVVVDLVAIQIEAVPIWQALGSAVLLGVALTLIPLGFGLASSQIAARRYRKAILSLEEEVDQLRGVPEEEQGQAGLAAGNTAVVPEGETEELKIQA